MNILLTGATGFIGQALTQHLNMYGHAITAAVRYPSDRLPILARQISVDALLPNTDWTQALSGVDTVIHLAARVHIMNEESTNTLEAFRITNTASTINLARQASMAGARRFIFISSIKVNGESTRFGEAFTESDVPDPQDPYSISKYEAEIGLLELMSQTRMDVVIIRPPLVYGPGVGANFLSMVRWLRRGLPLPFGAINNKRSLLALANLLDLITICLRHPAAANQTFLACDGEDISTTELLKRISRAMGKPSLLIPVPMLFLEGVATLFGKKAMIQRLCGSLQVDISKARKLLEWIPPLTVEEGLRRAVAGVNQNSRYLIHN
jgi:UDP-4-keto-D-QuiNAc 4-reductase